LGADSIHEADHTLNLVSKMVEWGKYAKVDPDNFKTADAFLPEDFVNPCRSIQKFKKNRVTGGSGQMSCPGLRQRSKRKLHRRDKT
jgi:hypothetical protein